MIDVLNVDLVKILVPCSISVLMVLVELTCDDVFVANPKLLILPYLVYHFLIRNEFEAKGFIVEYMGLRFMELVVKSFVAWMTDIEPDQ